MSVLKPGKKKKLPDGRVITFLETGSPDCEGCIFLSEDCTTIETGHCGSGRLDGKMGIFVECKDNEK